MHRISINEIARTPNEPIPYTEVDGKIVEDPEFVARREEVKETFRAAVVEWLDKTPRKEVFIFIHGFHNSFDDAAFTMAELWMIDQVTVALESLGMTVFSPYRDVGYGDPAAVVTGDLEGLEKATAVFACIDGTDPGTLFEVGYAVKKGIPVICYSQNPKPSDLTMMLGSKGCYIYDDFASAAYHAVWWARQ